MSSLWTPSGEHEIPSDEAETPSAPPSGPPSGPPPDAETEALMAEMAEARQRLAEVPADTVVTNHVMGLYELAAIHLSAEPPNLDEARLPIDAMGVLVDALGDRLAEHETVTAALGQIRMAFVELSNTSDQPSAG